MFRKLYSCVILLITSLLRLFGWRPTPRTAEEKKRFALEQELESAETYEAWRSIAEQLDKLNGFDKWREQSTEHFDAELARQRFETLLDLKRRGDMRDLMHHIRADLHRGIGGIWNPKMHEYRTGSKRLIEDYLGLVEQMLQFILEHPAVSSKEKYIFFTDLGAAYGHSALVLSGAAALGIYHVGPVKALHRRGLLPRVIAGTNTGALVAAIVCTHNDSDLQGLLEHIRFDVFTARNHENKKESATMRRLRRFIDHGVLMDINVLKDFLHSNIGDMTFMEAYRKTGRVLNIVCSKMVENGGKAYWTMNYLTAPHVVIWSAACAGCAVPGIYEQIDLMAKNCDGVLEPYHPAALKWCSGNFAVDEKVAWDRLSELFNINYFIVSETNINIMPAISKRCEGMLDTLWMVIREEVFRRTIQISNLPFMPKLDTIASLFSKPFEGDVEIFPASSLTDCLKLFTNPEIDMAKHCTLLGEKRTWPKINTISLLCRIERRLEQCIKHAKQQLAQESPQHLAFYTQELNLDLLNTL